MRIEKSSCTEKERIKDESLFNCSSGRLGVRGCFEEGAPDNELSIRGTYLNGFCEDEEISYNEKLYGFPTQKQTIVNLPDAQGIDIWAYNDKVTCWSNNASKFNYALDMEKGLVNRSFNYKTEKGVLELSFERFVSFKRPNIFVIKCIIKSINYDGTIKLKSYLNADVTNFTNSTDPRVASGNGKMLRINCVENVSNILKDSYVQKVEVETINSHRRALVLVSNEISNESVFDYEIIDNLSVATSVFSISSNDTIEYTKICYYNEIPNEINDYKELISARKDGFDVLKKEQESFMKDFWNNSRVIIEAKDIVQNSLDYCLYEMLCAAGKDGKTSIAAKGLSGEGYEGHYFWDCETYIFPFFLLTNPSIAKSLLNYRYSKLEDAKMHARTLGHTKGALYPWRTITGSECSSYYPSGSAQYHINADIARAFYSYWNITNDIDFLPVICEVLLETARLWIDVGHFDSGKFKIDCVTGPDEYTCLVNNNYYTNAGASENLRNAVELINLLKNSDCYNDFINKTNLTDDELYEFENAYRNMFLPYDEKLGIIKQDDSFLDKKKIDISSIPKENFPLLLHYHPLFLNRHQLCKQADAVLANYLFKKLDATTSMRTFEYYDSITTHDSSLSKCIFGIMSARLGNLDKAKNYFVDSLNIDLNDNNGNTRDGLHIANMGGCYHMIIGGFAGLDILDNKLSLFPMLPDSVDSCSFAITYRNVPINFNVTKDGTLIKTNVDCIKEPVHITIYGNDILLDKKEIFVKRVSKGVIFDLDGVITNTSIYHYQAWKKIADELGVNFDEKLNEQFKGVSRSKCLELLIEWGNLKISQEEFAEILERKNDYYKALLLNLSSKDILPGIIETINILHKEKIKVSLFSVSKNTDIILEKLQIADLFDVIVSGYDIEHSKPHYDGYLLAADRMGLDPRLCTMIEDSESGIIGAKNLAMKTIAIMKENKVKADIYVDSTKELVNIINYL